MAPTGASVSCVVEEPDQPGQVHRRVDLARAVLAGIGVVLVLLIARFATSTSEGLDSDVQVAAGLLPTLFLPVAAFITTLAALVLPIVLAVDAGVRRQFREFVHGLIAFAITAVIAFGLEWWIQNGATDELRRSLVGTAGTAAVPAFLAGGIALFSVVETRSRPRIRGLIWVAVGLGVIANVLSGATALSMLLTLLLGRAVGMTTRFALGTPNLRPTGEEIAATLAGAGFPPSRLTLVSDDHVRTYSALTPGGPLDVRVYDRDREGVGLLPAAWRAIRVREAIQRPVPRTMRQAVDRASLMALATERAGVSTPRLLAAREVDEDAIVTLLTHVQGVPLSETTDVSDAQLDAIWDEMRHVRESGLAHGELAARNVLLDGRHVNLIGWDAGEVASSRLRRDVDVAELLVTCALHVGPERAVASAMRVLGKAPVVRATALLQPIALSSATRADLKGRRELLGQLRDQIRGQAPSAEVPEVQLERLSPRTVFIAVAGALGAYVLLSQLGSVDLVEVISEADWAWGGVALLFSLVTYLAATMILIGFVSVPLRWLRTFLAQLAASFTSLVTPPAIGGLAVNVRYVNRAGAPVSVASAQVGVAQVGQFVVHLALLAIAIVITGVNTGSDLVPSERVLFVGLILLGLTVFLFLLPPIRRRIVGLVQPLLQQVIPALLDVAQTPKKLTLGLGGNLLLNVAYILCLYASLQAFGVSAPLSAVAVVYLAGAALGSAAPTPGGLGAVEAALVAGLTAVGIPSSVSVPGVLLFRLVTFWLPVAPGYLSLGYLQRKGAL
jgi:uncharacterized protein (TIRG00374 family)